MHPDDAYWDDRFAPLGVDGPVYAIAVSGDDVYVVGSFTIAGAKPSTHIARWNKPAATPNAAFTIFRL